MAVNPHIVPKMEYRYLGKSGLSVSVIGMWLLGGNEEAIFACMKAAYDAGINLFHVTGEYCPWKVNFGEAIRRFGWDRRDLVISVHFNCGSRYQNKLSRSRKSIIEGMNASLEKLGLEYVDLVYAGRPDGVTPMEEMVRAFNHLIDTGKAFYWGTSGWNAEEITDAWRVAEKLGLIGPLAENPKYNISQRKKVEREYAPLYAKHGLGLITCSYSKGGHLTGGLDLWDFRTYVSGDEQGLKDLRDYEISGTMKPIAKSLGITRTQLVLAWVLKNPQVSSVIIPMDDVHEGLQALNALPLLTPQTMSEIDTMVENRLVLVLGWSDAWER